MRRGFVGVVAALSLGTLALLAGLQSCTAGGTGSSDVTGSTSPSPSVSPTGPVTLRLAVYGDAQAVTTYRALASDWNDAHPDITVRVSSSPDERTAAHRLTRELADGTAPDLFLVDHEQLPDLVAAHRVQPVDVLLEQRGVLFGDTYQRLGLEGFSADSALQCMPHDVSPLVVYYNTALVRPARLATPDAPVPDSENGWTWQQFTRAARSASTGEVKGVYLAPTLTTLLPLVRSAGADLVDNDRLPTTLTMSTGGARDALEQVLAVARDRRVTPSQATLARHSPLELFESGRLAMMLGTRALVPKLRETPKLGFDVLPLPSLGQPRTVAEMNGYCISADSEHIPQAADFLAYASSADGARTTSSYGGVVPANLEALHSDAFLERGDRPAHPEVYVDALRRADAMPFVPGWPRVEADTEPQLAKLFFAPQPDLDTLLTAIDTRSQRVLAPPSASPSPTS